MVTEGALVANLGWEARRARVALDQLVRDGGLSHESDKSFSGWGWIGVDGHSRI